MSKPKGRKGKMLYSNKFGFILYQQNGQRTYGGPPPNWGSRPIPSRDCEVFIGRLPRMCFEDELIPLFLTAGELYEFRLMLDFSGTNRGYAYAHYATLSGAQRAIEHLNKYEIRPGHQIGVLKSKNNCRLLFGNIESTLDMEAFNEFIRTTTDQVLNVLMFKNFQQLKQTDFRISSEVEEAFLGRMPRNNGNNQFAIVEYENHKAAAVARRILVPKYGHILAIDWAVPPRDRKRLCYGPDSQTSSIERPLSNSAIKDPNLQLLSKANSKIRPVPILLVQPSSLDKVPFMPKTFKAVVKFFKYQLSVGLYKSVDHLEIPLFICREIERKIVNRITNLENCSQAVQLIFNYFSWYNEKKRFLINSEVQNILEEVKIYADLFVLFVNKRLKHGPSQNPAEDNYYIHILPLQLNILFRIILRSDAEYQARLSSGITSGLKWLVEITKNGTKSSREFIEEIINLVQNEDGTSLDKASTLAKSLFLNTIIASQESQNIASDTIIDLPLQKNSPFKNGNIIESALVGEKCVTQQLVGNHQTFSSQLLFHKVPADFNLRQLKGSTGHYIPMPFSQIGKFHEEITKDANVFPPVPLLLIPPSIMNKVPFMPDIFNNILIYFKYLIKVCVSINTWQMSIPRQICHEIQKKIIDRISNMENCVEGVHLILNYFTCCSEKKPCSMNLEVENLLKEVKTYADSFVNFVWNKAMSVYIPNEAVENYFCKVLPLRLNFLFHMMLIFRSDNSLTALIGITKGLKWLDEFIQKEDKTVKQFLEELTRFIVESDPSAYERAKNLGKTFCADLINSIGQPISHEDMFCLSIKDDLLEGNSSSNVKGCSNLVATSSDTVSDNISEYDS